MIKKLLLIPVVLFSILFIWYLLLSSYNFPDPLPESLQSHEPADSETPDRRAYFTNMTREEVMDHYRSQFEKDMPFTLRLNYPPEDAQTIIRDQTRSTFLEELTHPFRESIYVNGFEPKEPKDFINVGGKDWRQKVTVKFVTTDAKFRILIAFPTIIFIYLVLHEWIKEWAGLFRNKNEN